MIRYSRDAQVDLSQVSIECARRSGARLALNLRDRIDSTIWKTLGVFPECGRPRPEFGVDIRSFPTVPYVVFYRVKERDVEILRVIHGHRDINRNILSLLAS